MIEHLREKLKILAELSKEDVGNNENSVKYNFIIPLLECFGHHRLDFEHSAQGNRIDIYIEKQSSCGFVVEAKSYDKNLNECLVQLKDYSDVKRPFLAIISNGAEIRFYSPLWRVANFSDTLLYSIKRVDLNNDEIIERLEKLFSKDNLDNELLHDYIDEREKEIRNANKEIELKTKEYKNKEDEISNARKILEDKITEIKTQISEKDKNILDLKKEKEDEIKKLKEKYRLPIIIPYSLVLNPDKSMVDLKTEDFERKSPVSLSTLIQYGKIKEGDKLIFCDKHGRKPYHDEYAIVEGNGLRYRDFELDSPSNLAKELRYRLGLTKNKQETQGPIFWITENRKLLHDLNNEVREEMNVTSFEQMQDEKPKKNMVEVERQKESLREAERKKEEEDKPKNENIMRKIEKERASIDKCR